MAIVKRGNRELTVSDLDVGKYLADGYDEIEAETGGVKQKATAGRTVTIEEHNKIVAEKDAIIKRLEREIGKASGAKKK